MLLPDWFGFYSFSPSNAIHLVMQPLVVLVQKTVLQTTLRKYADVDVRSSHGTFGAGAYLFG